VLPTAAEQPPKPPPPQTPPSVQREQTYSHFYVTSLPTVPDTNPVHLPVLCRHGPDVPVEQVGHWSEPICPVPLSSPVHSRRPAGHRATPLTPSAEHARVDGCWQKVRAPEGRTAPPGTDRHTGQAVGVGRAGRPAPHWKNPAPHAHPHTHTGTTAMVHGRVLRSSDQQSGCGVLPEGPGPPPAREAVTAADSRLAICPNTTRGWPLPRISTSPVHPA
jgi:hypothetical protein